MSNETNGQRTALTSFDATRRSYLKAKASRITTTTTSFTHTGQPIITTIPLDLRALRYITKTPTHTPSPLPSPEPQEAAGMQVLIQRWMRS